MPESDWAPEIQAATAHDRDRFTISLGELEYDDPFTAVISYDGRYPQPWSRVDIHREIVDVAYIDVKETGNAAPTVLSNEGDVYIIGAEHIDRSKIAGAGVLSDDAEGFGAVHTLIVDGETQYVVGDSRQLYCRRAQGSWERLLADKTRAEGYEAEHFGAAVLIDGKLVIEGNQRPYSTPDPHQMNPAAWADVTPDQFLKMMQERRAERAAKPRIQRVYEYSSGSLRNLNAPPDCIVKSLYGDDNGNLWLFGVSGLIMENLAGSFRSQAFHGDKETLFSATKLRSEFVLATDNGLRRFDGHVLSVVKPALNYSAINQNVPTPLKVQTVGNELFYFDRKHGVCRWDGQNNWDWLTIPKELLGREFTGLSAK